MVNCCNPDIIWRHLTSFEPIQDLCICNENLEMIELQILPVSESDVLIKTYSASPVREKKVIEQEAVKGNKAEEETMTFKQVKWFIRRSFCLEPRISPRVRDLLSCKTICFRAMRGDILCLRLQLPCECVDRRCILQVRGDMYSRFRAGVWHWRRHLQQCLSAASCQLYAATEDNN